MKAAVNAQDPIINVLSEIFEHDPNVTHEQIILEAARIKAPPTTSVLRINTILTDSDNALKTAAKILLDQSPAFQVYRPSNLPNVLFVNSLGPYDPQPFKRQAMVSRECAQAVLRGSHVFSPGIIAIQDDTSEEDQVSVWADLDGKCTRGYRLEYLGAKKFVGNGILKMV
jgi:predicted ribosome-associated RNA-binding protein Tma20